MPWPLISKSKCLFAHVRRNGTPGKVWRAKRRISLQMQHLWSCIFWPSRIWGIPEQHTEARTNDLSTILLTLRLVCLFRNNTNISSDTAENEEKLAKKEEEEEEEDLIRQWAMEPGMSENRHREWRSSISAATVESCEKSYVSSGLNPKRDKNRKITKREIWW